MGIKYFYTWIKQHYSECIHSKIHQRSIDVLAIDMNGLFHASVEKIYKQNNKNYIIHHSSLPKHNLHLFKEICSRIEYIKNVIAPKKKLLLCVDGVAGLGKLNQQRQRRFRNSLTNVDITFDINNFTPGTKLMDYLTKYIDWYIRTMITFNADWQNIEIIFSNEKVQGEGEHKMIQYIKKYTLPSDSICIVGSDADLILLGLLLPHPNIFICRTHKNEYFEYINIVSLKQQILQSLTWEQKYQSSDEPIFHPKQTLYDFILLTFLFGNDFLPSIYSLNIYDGIFDEIIILYKEHCKNYGNLVYQTTTGNLYLQIESLANFFYTLNEKEHTFLERKYNSQKSFFPDPLIIKNMSLSNDKFIIDIDSYRQQYYSQKFHSSEMNPTIVKSYLDGMLWTLIYYDRGIPDWTWFYPYYYAPLLSDFSIYLKNQYKHPHFKNIETITPFLQLLLVLPPSSNHLLPDPLSQLVHPSSELGKYYPNNLEIDLTGKDKEWEGIIKLPIIQYGDFKRQYDTILSKVHSNELRRNIQGKNFSYKYDPLKTSLFTSFYGSIPNCPVIISLLST